MNINKKKLFSTISAIFIFIPVLAGFAVPQKAGAVLSTTRNIVFPAIGKVSYSNDFGAPRSGGRTHEGNDIFGKKMTPLVAAVNGTISFVVWPEATYGYMVSIKDSEGFKYNYLHINNDNIATDDGKGGGGLAYAAGIEQGAKVVRGQLIGFMGDSGNAETTAPHLHFEIRASDDAPLNPYESLQVATKITTPVPTPQQDDELLPYGEFTGGASIAIGNINKDSSQEIVTGAGPGGGPHVRRFDSIPTMPSNNTSISGDFFAYSTSFRGGIDVAVGDVDDDGKDEIITAPGPGGGPHVKVFKADGVLVSEFMAYAGNFTGGVNVTAADLDGDGKAEIITAPKSRGTAHVKVFQSNGILKSEFFAYDASFVGGADVAAIPKIGRKDGLIITGAGPGGGPSIKTFSFEGKEQNNFLAYDTSFTGGVRVSIGKLKSSFQIATAPASGGGADFRIFSLTGSLSKKYTAFEKWYSGGFDIAVNGSTPTISTMAGSRRTTVRAVQSSSRSDTCTNRSCRNSTTNQ